MSLRTARHSRLSPTTSKANLSECRLFHRIEFGWLTLTAGHLDRHSLGKHRTCIDLATQAYGALDQQHVIGAAGPSEYFATWRSSFAAIERRYPANPDLDAVDGIIVLGGGENDRASAFWSQVQLNEGVEHYTAALARARRFPQAQVLFAVGSGALRDAAGATVSETAIAERFFLEQGISPERLLLEEAIAQDCGKRPSLSKVCRPCSG